jgi:hypothetical protein
MGDLLEAEGFEVTRLLGTGQRDDEMVFGRQVFNAVAEPVEDLNVGQLVVYFSGHGVLSGGLEYWLLSDGPRDSSEAIAPQLAMIRAMTSGVRNVVLISDACRSSSASWGLNNITGRQIFPGDHVYGHSDVDIFYGTALGDEAVEMSVDERGGAYEGVFTSALLKAFRNPTPDMVETLADDLRVVPNKRLKSFLINEVRQALKSKPRFSQTPDAYLMAEEPTYIARVRESWSPDSACVGIGADCSQRQVEAISLPAALQSGIEEALHGNANFLRWQDATAPEGATRKAAALVGYVFERQREDLILEFPGIAVYGGGIVDAAGVGIDARLAGEGELGPNRIEADLDGPGASVVVRFTNGSGTILPVLREFSTHVTLGETGIRELRFNPLGYSIENEYLLSLRALAGEAMRAGVLRFEGSAEERRETASRFADTVRMGKGTDPTLGLYAAYAYFNALIPEGARSVHEIMRGDLGVELFDVAVLADDLGNTCGADRLTPPFPMLRQGWELLGPKGVSLHPALAEMRPNLTEALWTTFDTEGAARLLNLVREGVLPC